MKNIGYYITLLHSTIFGLYHSMIISDYTKVSHDKFVRLMYYIIVS